MKGRVATSTPSSGIRPFWSIMIPVYNPDINLLRETIESVFTATSGPDRCQIAMVDDGSTVSLDTFYEEVASRGVEIYRNRERVGIMGNWNQCLAHARGQWVHLLHQDDRILPDFYRAMEAGIAAVPAIGAAFSQISFIDDAGAFIRKGHMTQQEAGVMNAWIENITVNLVAQCPGMVVRREVYDRLGGFDTSFSYNADQEMWQRIAVEYPIWYDPRPMAEYRVHPASATYQLYDLKCRWRERRACLEKGLTAVSPLVRDRVRYSGEFYRTCLAWNEWVDAWRKVSGFSNRIKLLASLAHIGDFRYLIARKRRKYPRPIPGLAPVREVDPIAPRQKRILFLSEFYPADPMRSVFGVYQRMKMMLEACQNAGHVDVLFFWGNNYQVPEEKIAEYRENMVAHGWPMNGELLFIATSAGAGAESRRRPIHSLWCLLKGIATFMHNRPTLASCGTRQTNKFRDVLLKYQPDLVFVHRLGAYGALSQAGLTLPPVVMDLDDVEHVKLRRMHAGARKIKDRLYLLMCEYIARQAERRACRLANCVFVCSESDRQAIQQVTAGTNLRVVPNVARLPDAIPTVSSPSALFIGIAHYPPNREAILLLVNEIWPRVRAKLPKAQLHIAGQGSALVAASDDACGIKVWGFVENVDDCYRESAIAVCPIMKGSGTRVKIIESAFRNRPVVSTSIGAEGLEFVPGEEIVITDDWDEFANAVVELLTDEERRMQMGAAAEQKAMELYHPEKIQRQISVQLNDLIQRGVKS
ncbi:MAG TPA: glycosyltransferase [Kiritimatiellia bacterium]|nr:glycosyltransferase [Kiritimatiellia bacterium]